MTKRPKTKAAKDIEAGDWCEFGTLAVLAGEPWTNDEGKICIPLGYRWSEFRPDERITIHYEEKDHEDPAP